MLKDERWQVARLIPISSASGIEAQERRAASVDVDRRKVRGRALHHWSWIAVLTEAVMQKSVLTTAKDFYAQVMQNVRAWKAAPPKLAPAPEPAPPPKERIISLSVEVVGGGSPPVAGERGDRGSAAGREA